MKIVKKLSILLFIVSIGIFGAFLYYEKISKDTVAPVVECESEQLELSVNASEADLLWGVTAMDDQAGDVTDTIVIEKMSAFAEDGKRILTYAAIDEHGNVGRAQRELVYTDYVEPRFSLTGPLRYPLASNFDLLGKVQATSSLDGTLTDNVKYALQSSVSTSSVGYYPIEYRVTDSAGIVSYLNVDIEIYDPTEERISVVLSDYLVYLEVGSSFKAKSYFVGSDIDGTLKVKSNVNTEEPGIYTVDYTVTGTNSMGKSRLIVIVTD